MRHPHYNSLRDELELEIDHQIMLFQKRHPSARVITVRLAEYPPADVRGWFERRYEEAGWRTAVFENSLSPMFILVR